LSKVPANIPDPEKPESIIKGVTDVTRVVDGEIEFGNPTDPRDDESTTLAGSGTPTEHNGSIQNIKGSWVEVEIGATGAQPAMGLDEAVECIHNLDVPVVATDEPNVRWFVAGIQHDGAQQTRWEDLRVPVTATRRGPANIPGFLKFTDNGAASTGVYLHQFDDNNDEDLFFTAQIPHNYKQSTDIGAHVHWTPDLPTTPALDEVVQWELEYMWESLGDDFVAGSTTVVTSTTHTPADATLVPGRHYLTSFGTLTGTGQGVSSMLICRVSRNTDASDTFTGPGNHDACLLEIDFHYEVENLGSNVIGSKSDAVATQSQVVSVHYDTDDTVYTDRIPLRFNAAESLLVDDNHKMKVTLFFIPAVR